MSQRFLEARRVFLNGAVNDESANRLVAELLYLEAASPGTPIDLYINSSGGSLWGGFAVYDTMRAISSPVRTICIGRCRSMAAVLLAADWSLACDDLGAYRGAGAVFLVLYVLGIPAAFLHLLYTTARPKEWPDVPPRELIELQRQQERRERRYFFLYDVYEPGQWWWEVSEMARKLVMTSCVVFIAPSTSSQIFISAILAIGFLLLSTFYNPFIDAKLDMLNFVAQSATVLTLLSMLGDRTGLDADEFPLTNAGFIDVVLFICQLAPCVMALGLLVAAMSRRAASSRGQRKFYASLPAIVRQEPPAAPRSRGLLARAKRLVPTKRLVVTAERPTPTGAREITHVNTGVLRTH